MPNPKPNIDQAWEDFLNPETLRTRLISASLYIAAYEILKATLIDRIKSFFTRFSIPPDTTEYEKEVLSKNRSLLHASLQWYTEMGVIDKDDLASFKRIKHCRNELAHELLHLAGGHGIASNISECFEDLVRLLRKVEVWWIKEVDMAVNPDLEGVDAKDDEITPGSLIMLETMRDIALGDSQSANRYLDILKTRKPGHT